MNGTTVTDGVLATDTNGAVITLPGNWSVAAAADIDGDGYTDLVLQNSSTLQEAVWFTRSSTVTAGALPSGWQVTGANDANRDGIPDLILQNPSTGQVTFWYLGGVTLAGDTQLPDRVIVADGALVGSTLPANWLISAPR